jgi:hypothetical protein
MPAPEFSSVHAAPKAGSQLIPRRFRLDASVQPCCWCIWTQHHPKGIRHSSNQGASACWARAGHLFGPILIRSPNPRFLHGPFPVGDVDRPFLVGIWTGPFPDGDINHPLSSWGHGLAPFRLRIPTRIKCAFMSGTKGCLEAAWRQSAPRVHEYLKYVVQEIRWADRLDPFNHCSHFLFFMTHFTDSMPITSIGGIWSADLGDSKCASHVFKVAVVVDTSLSIQK